MNICIFSGRLGRDPERKATKTGTEFCTFSMAINRKDSKGNETTDWIDCCAWGTLCAYIVNTFAKGDLISIWANAVQKKWTDKDGTTHTNIEFNVNEVCCPKWKKTASAEAPVQHQAFGDGNGFQFLAGEDEQLPF